MLYRISPSSAALRGNSVVGDGGPAQPLLCDTAVRSLSLSEPLVLAYNVRVVSASRRRHCLELREVTVKDHPPLLGATAGAACLLVSSEPRGRSGSLLGFSPLSVPGIGRLLRAGLFSGCGLYTCCQFCFSLLSCLETALHLPSPPSKGLTAR